jgi:hypothetical protein
VTNTARITIATSTPLCRCCLKGLKPTGRG